MVQYLVLHPKKEMLLLESFGFKGLKNFIIQDDKKIINKIFVRLEKFKQADNKLKQSFLELNTRKQQKSN